MSQENEINEQLGEAAKKGNFDEVRRLVEMGADVNHGDIPPFLSAFFSDHKDIVKYLLEKGGNVNHDKFSEVSLLMAAVNQEDLEFAEYLIEVGADVNLSLPRGGETALHKAAVNNKFRSMKMLIDNGGDVDLRAKEGGHSDMDGFRDLWGETPLHIAAVRSDKDVIKLLLDAGADKTLKTTQGRTPLDYAVQFERPAEIVQILQE